MVRAVLQVTGTILAFAPIGVMIGGPLFGVPRGYAILYGFALLAFVIGLAFLYARLTTGVWLQPTTPEQRAQARADCQAWMKRAWRLQFIACIALAPIILVLPFLGFSKSAAVIASPAVIALVFMATLLLTRSGRSARPGPDPGASRPDLKTRPAWFPTDRSVKPCATQALQTRRAAQGKPPSWRRSAAGVRPFPALSVGATPWLVPAVRGEPSRTEPR